LKKPYLKKDKGEKGGGVDGGGTGEKDAGLPGPANTNQSGVKTGGKQYYLLTPKNEDGESQGGKNLGVKKKIIW